MPKQKSDLSQAQDHNQYDANQMGKQRKKPVMAPRETKKAKGARKHSLRKEK